MVTTKNLFEIDNLHRTFLPAVVKVARNISKDLEKAVKGDESKSIKWSKKTLSAICKLTTSDDVSKVTEEVDSLWQKKPAMGGEEKVKVKVQDAVNVRKMVMKLVRFLKFVPVEFYDMLAISLLPLLLCALEVLCACIPHDEEELPGEMR